MNKELFVSATPHETKVGITEDDQLAEIYLERENEYTLAGSIYKGRVTRVLPGMQSAFVDVGLERDAFLYVSDFMDLEQQDEDLDEPVPANRPVNGGGQPRRAEAVAAGAESAPVDAGDGPDEGDGFESAGPEQTNAGDVTRGDGRDARGRRRRRGRRPDNSDRGRPPAASARSEARTDQRGETRTDIRTDTRNDQRPDQRSDQRSERSGRFERGGSSSRFQRPPASGRGRDYDYGPPPGYQPILLPGESISKYRQTPSAVAPVGSVAEPEIEEIASSFPEDEPMFAGEIAEPLHEQHDDVARVEADEDVASASASMPSPVSEFRSAAPLESETEVVEEEVVEEIEAVDRELPRGDGLATAVSAPEASEVKYDAGRGHVEEQEIEEEEADLAAYGNVADEDDDFEEVEEETHAPGTEALSASVGEESPAGSETAEVAEPAAAGENGEVSEAVLEAEEREAEELELEEAQAEAEALLEAEAIGAGVVDASAVVRAAPPEARLLQRARRVPDLDRRRGGRRGQRRRFRSRENTVVPQISELLKEGQEILVQIAKEPIGKKGARITSHIALPGRFLVFMPTVNHTGVSRKISSEEERQRLKRIIQSERENGGGGFIVRTAAAGASDEELRADIRFLKNLWNEIKSRSESSKPPALIYHDLNVVERVLRDQVSSDFSVIWVDTETEYERILRFANRFQPALVRRVKLYTKETPLFEQFGLNEEINKALKSKVWLKSGGYIVINQTEALVAIDVNTGKYVGKTSRLEDTIVKTNVDAIREIVRQIRLRDLGGIIIIDFIDMDERRNRQKVMQALEEALRADRAPSKVLQFNDFGLVAITRKRVKQSLERTIGSPCPYCQATGFVKAVNTICNEIYVEMRKISQHLEHSDVMLRVNPDVAKALKANNAHLLNEMEELAKKTIIVKSDPALHQEQFDIN
ncbi:MAG: Rne/Rng family ribonuclease [Terriglobales bacterium]|jgi:ribonuclease G